MMFNLGNAVLDKLLTTAWKSIEKNEALQDEILAFLIAKIPAIATTATPLEVRVAIKEGDEFNEAVQALLKPADEVV
jgi:hypothetical protein